jgi:Lsr2
VSREVAFIFRDDLDGSVTSLNGEITEVTLGYCGNVVSLDLGPVNKDLLEQAIKPFLAAGTPVSGYEPAIPVGENGTPMSKVALGRRMRAFAAEHNIQVPKYGNTYRYPLELRQRFSLATGIPLSMLEFGKNARRD